MKLHLSRRSLPEFSNLTPDDRKRLWASCRGKPFRHWSMWAVLGAFGLMMPLMGGAMFLVPTDRAQVVEFYTLMGLILIPGPAAMMVLVLHVHTRLVRRWLGEVRRKGACPVCGYDLRASPGCCPECGMTVTRDAGNEMSVISQSNT